MLHGADSRWRPPPEFRGISRRQPVAGADGLLATPRIAELGREPRRSMDLFEVQTGNFLQIEIAVHVQILVSG